MNVNLYVIEDYENKPPSGSKKTNPNKANFRKAKMNKKSLARKSGHTQNIASTGGKTGVDTSKKIKVQS